MAFVAGNTVTMIVVRDTEDADSVRLEAYNEAGIGRILSVELDDRAELLDGTVIGDDARKRQKGLEDWLIRTEIFFDTLADYTPTFGTPPAAPLEGEEDFHDIRPGSQVTFRIRPEGTGGGNFQREAEGMIESSRMPVVVDDLVKFDITIRCKGDAVVRDVQS